MRASVACSQRERQGPVRTRARVKGRVRARAKARVQFTSALDHEWAYRLGAQLPNLILLTPGLLTQRTDPLVHGQHL